MQITDNKILINLVYLISLNNIPAIIDFGFIIIDYLLDFI